MIIKIYVRDMKIAEEIVSEIYRSHHFIHGIEIIGDSN